MEIIIGAFTSVIVQLIKKYAGTTGWITWATAIILSILGASIFVFYKDTEYWPTVVAVLTTSGAFYTYILARFEK